MRFSVALPLLCAAVGPSFVRAVDDRLLYTIPAGDDMVGFTVDFGNACAKWQPALDAGLTFEEFLVEPGDFSGKNPDTEAKIFCAWSGGMTFTVDVAASLGATPTAD